MNCGFHMRNLIVNKLDRSTASNMFELPYKVKSESDKKSSENGSSIPCLFSSCNCEMVTSELLAHLGSFHCVQIVPGLNAVVESNWNDISRRVPVVLTYQEVSFAVTIEETVDDVFIWIAQLDEQVTSSCVDYRIQIRLQNPVIEYNTRTFSQMWEGRPWPAASVGNSSPSDAFVLRKSSVLKNFSARYLQQNGWSGNEGSSSIIISITEIQMFNPVVLHRSPTKELKHADCEMEFSQVAGTVAPASSPLTPSVLLLSDYERDDHYQYLCDTLEGPKGRTTPAIEETTNNDANDVTLKSDKTEEQDQDLIVFAEEAPTSTSANDNLDEFESQSLEEEEEIDADSDSGSDSTVTVNNEDEEETVVIPPMHRDPEQERLSLLKELRSIRLPTMMQDELQESLTPQVSSPESESEEHTIFQSKNKRKPKPKLNQHRHHQMAKYELIRHKPVAKPVVKPATAKIKDPANVNKTIFASTDRSNWKNLNATAVNSETNPNRRIFENEKYIISGYPAVARHKATMMDMDGELSDALVAELEYFSPDVPLKELAEDVTANHELLGFGRGTYQQNWQLEPDINLMEIPKVTSTM